MIHAQKFQIASSKSQMDSTYKPIRLTHGTPNPSKALLIKHSLP